MLITGFIRYLQKMAREGAQYLGEPLDPLLTSSLEGLGGGSVSGATRGQVVEARDTLKSRLLTRALQARLRSRSIFRLGSTPAPAPGKISKPAPLQLRLQSTCEILIVFLEKKFITPDDLKIS